MKLDIDGTKQAFKFYTPKQTKSAGDKTKYNTTMSLTEVF